MKCIALCSAGMPVASADRYLVAEGRPMTPQEAYDRTHAAALEWASASAELEVTLYVNLTAGLSFGAEMVLGAVDALDSLGVTVHVHRYTSWAGGNPVRRVRPQVALTPRLAAAS